MSGSLGIVPRSSSSFRLNRRDACDCRRLFGAGFAHFIYQRGSGYARQKQFALDQTKAWIFSVDADEWLDGICAPRCRLCGGDDRSPGGRCAVR
jgi:hypothetical protein